VVGLRAFQFSERDMDNACNPPELFAKLSPRVAGALAAHLGRGEMPSGEPEGRAALDLAWAALPHAARAGHAEVFARLTALSARAARPFLLAEARESWGDTYPAVLRLLDAISTPDLAVRMYLESPSAVERAHFRLATRLVEQIDTYQGQYVADVIPSRDRRGRMLRVMQATHHTRADAALRVSEFVSDDRFLIALHRGAHLSPKRCFDGAQTLDPELARPEIELLVLFRFDASRLVVKAPRAEQRQSLRDAFVQIFVGDPLYFEPRVERRSRYHLTLSPHNVSGGYRWLATAAPSVPSSLPATESSDRLLLRA